MKNINPLCRVHAAENIADQQDSYSSIMILINKQSRLGGTVCLVFIICSLLTNTDAHARTRRRSR